MHYTSRFVKKDGKLYNVSSKDNAAYDLFVKSLEEGSVVEMYMSIEKDNGSLAQLAKIHAMCRTLADHIGETFQDMKLLVKEKAGLVAHTESGVHVKSFSVCSKEELSLAIQAAKEIGELVNCLVD